MKIRHEVLIAELKVIIKDLSSAMESVEDPVVVETFSVGLGSSRSLTHPYQSEGIPEGIKICDMDGVDVEELRAELLLAAGKLEVLASL